MDQERLLRSRKRKEILFPVREGPLVSQIKLDPEKCLPPGMVPTLSAFFGSPENWFLKGISVEPHKPE